MTDGYAWGTTGEQRAYPADRLGKPSRRRGLPFFMGGVRKPPTRTEGRCGTSKSRSRVGREPKRKGRPCKTSSNCWKTIPTRAAGIVVGKDTVYYFIMGRSVNSRNRIFATEPDGIRTEAHDPALLEDPSLIIYHPVRTMGDALW